MLTLQPHVATLLHPAPLRRCKPFQPLGPRRSQQVCSTARTGMATAEELYQLVNPLGPGADPTTEQRQRIDELVEQIEVDKPPEAHRPLENPLIFANYQVAYTSTKKAPRQQGQPAGGRFRGGLGRALFQTTELCQTVMQPNTVTNKLGFAFLGLLRGSVGLRGTFEAVGEDADTVKVSFQPPTLTLGSNVSVAIGPPSSVVLTTTYLDERLRLGRGSRGSRFVFIRGGYADDAGMAEIGLRKTTAAGWALLAAALTGLVACTAALAASNSIFLKILAVFTGLLAVASTAVVWRGGQN